MCLVSSGHKTMKNTIQIMFNLLIKLDNSYLRDILTVSFYIYLECAPQFREKIEPTPLYKLL